MASVAKWLRQWIVVPPFAGSSPVVRPYFNVCLMRLSPIKGENTIRQSVYITLTKITIEPKLQEMQF